MKWRVVMQRKLAVILTCVGLAMSPLSVQALGFGGIKLSSSLNEKLDAEVALLSATKNDIQSLKIRLATEEAFLRAGIARNSFLNGLEFKVKQYSDGNYYIHITTKESVREPFLDFLLDINWKNGRMLREYTMLIDPPGRTPTQVPEPAPIITATVAPKPKPVVQPTPVIEPAPVIEPEPEVVPVVEAASEPVQVPEPVAEVAAPVTPKVVDVKKQEEIARAIEESFAKAASKLTSEVFDPESAFVEDGSDELWPRIPLSAYSEEGTENAEPVTEEGSLDYGITKADDNLWKIAEKLRQGNKNISVYQVMMALLQSNPNAFDGNNVHRLKVGHVLRIEDASKLTALTRKEAANAYIEQTNTWNNYRNQTADTASAQAIIADNTQQEMVSEKETSGELILSSPSGENLNSGGGANEETLNNDLATMRDQLRQSKADAGTNRTRNIALNEKLQLLEEELNRLQRSISIKDDELAALQQKLSVSGAEKATPAAMPEEVKEVVEAETMSDIKPMVEAVPEPVDVPTPAVSPVAIAEEIAKREEANKTEEGMMDMVIGVGASIAAITSGLLAGGSLLFIAPIALILLVLLGVMIKRRRQGDKFQESILTGAATDTSEDSTADSSTVSEESSFLSDFAMSGAGEIETDDSEVDPLTEADVFIAYGRHEAAEERLNEAISNEPERLDLRAKMLELHHAMKNKDAFETGAEELYASLDENKEENPLWQKIVDLGAEVAPENPLFIKDVLEEAETDDVVTNDEPVEAGMSDSEVMDIGLETGVFEAGDLSTSDSNDSDLDMDFDLDLDKDIEVFTAEEDKDKADMDFNLELDADETTGPESDTVEEASSEDTALDFNLEEAATTQELAADLDMTATVLTDADDAGLDFNLEVDNSAAEELETTAESEVEETESTDDNALDFNLDMGDTAELEETIESESTETTSSDNDLDFDLGMSDDISTDEKPEEKVETDSLEIEDDLSLDMLSEELESSTDDNLDDSTLDLSLGDENKADDDLVSGDEVGTKLDLAKAYIDMGDPEGARSILSEVMEEGNDTQKEEAQDLIGQIV